MAWSHHSVLTWTWAKGVLYHLRSLPVPIFYWSLPLTFFKCWWLFNNVDICDFKKILGPLTPQPHPLTPSNIPPFENYVFFISFDILVIFNKLIDINTNRQKGLHWPRICGKKWTWMSLSKKFKYPYWLVQKSPYSISHFPTCISSGKQKGFTIGTVVSDIWIFLTNAYFFTNPKYWGIEIVDLP